MISTRIEDFFSKKSASKRYHFALQLIHDHYHPSHCFIARLKENDQFSKVLCHLINGELADNFSYSLTSTPCQQTVQQSKHHSVCIINNVQERFPNDIALQKWNISAYLGITLTSYDLKPVGILVCLFKQNINPKDFDNRWFTKLSKVVGSEMNQQLKNKAFQKLFTQLEIGEKLANLGTWRWNMTTEQLFCSRQVYSILALPNQTPLNFNKIKSLIYKDDLVKVNELLIKIKRGEINHYNLNHRLIVNEKIKKVHVIGEVEIDDDGDSWLNASIQDVSTKEKMQEDLALSSIVFNHASDAIMITDADNKIISVNRALETITGYKQEELLGKQPNIFSSGHHNAEFYQTMWQELKKHKQWKGEILNQRKDGNLYPEELSLNVVTNSSGEISHYIAIFRDISKRKETEQRLEFLSNKEPLTGLSNRIHFIEHINQQISQAHRHNNTFILILINVDRFKEINSVYGQSIGDLVLKIIANRLKDIIRNEDTICRYAGDEFCILLPNTSILGAEIVSQKIQESINSPIILEQTTLELTFSMGIAQYPLSGLSTTELLKNCTLALQYVKANGGNAISFHDANLQKQYLNKLSIREKLKHALNAKKLQVYYQPIVETNSEIIHKFEALIRWQEKNGNFISPAEFIPIAEEFGMIHLIGQFVLEQACQDLKKMHDLGFSTVSFSINRSICEFNKNINEDKSIEKTIKNAGLPLDSIVIEITESVAMSSNNHTGDIIRSLKNNGVKIALDDFCTGYSSLSYLVQYQADFIKIDKSFIDTLLIDNSSLILITTLIELADKLNMKVIAEGVESKKQLRKLRELGCHFIQGYVYSPAVPYTQCLTLVHQNEKL